MNTLLKTALFFCVFLFSFSFLEAQIPYSTAWAEVVGGPSSLDEVNALFVEGPSLWVAGSVPGVVGSKDIYIDEYVREGGAFVQRRLQIGGTGDDTIVGLKKDILGNFYIAGHLNQPLNFNPNGPTTIVGQSAGGKSMAFVAKYNSSFILEWVDTLAVSTVDVQTTAFEIEEGGSAFWAISFEGVIQGLSGTSISATGRDALLTRLDPSTGQGLWEQHYRSNTGLAADNEYIRDIAVNTDSNYLIIAGTHNGDLLLPQNASPYPNQGGLSSFIARYEFGNTFDWGMTFDTDGEEIEIAIDNERDLLYTSLSQIAGTAINLNPMGTSVSKIPSYYPNSVFLSQYDAATGFYIQDEEFGDANVANQNPVIISDIDVDDAGLIYLGGAFGSTSSFSLNAGTTTLSNNSAAYGGLLLVFEDDAGTLEFKDATVFDPSSGGEAKLNCLDATNIGYVFAGGGFNSAGMECNPDNAVSSSINISSNQIDGFVFESRVLRAPHPADLGALFELKNATGNWNSSLIASGEEWDTLATNNNFHNFYGVDTLYDPDEPFYRVALINMESLFDDYGVKMNGTLPNTLMDGDKLDYIHLLRLARQDLTGGPTMAWDTMEYLLELSIDDNQFTYDANLFVYLTENAPNIDWILADSYLSPAEVAMEHPFPNFPQNGPGGAFYANLKDIDIIHNGLSGTLPHPLQFSPVIEGYGFVHNNLTDIANPGTTPIPNLFRIELDNNKFTDISDLAAILNNAPVLHNVWCTNMMDTTVVHNTPNLSIASSTITEVLLGQNNINIGSGLSLEDMMSPDTEIFDFSYNKTLSFSGPTSNKPNLRGLSLAHNGMTDFMEDQAHLNLFINCPGLEELDLSGNYFNGRLPNPLQAGEPVYKLAMLRYFNINRGPDTSATILTNQRLRGELNLNWLLGAQFQQGNPKIEYLNVGNQNFKDIKTTALLLSGLRLDSLIECHLDSNRLEFDDLYRMVQIGGMQQSTNSFFPHYLTANANIDAGTNSPDTLSFTYTGQKPDGVGGIRRRPENEPIWFDNAIGMPFNLVDTIYNEVYYYRSDTFDQAGLPFAQLPANAEVIGGISTDATGNINIQLNPALTVTPNTVLINPDTSTTFYNIIAITAVDSTHSDRYYTALALNDSFPQTAVYTLPKLLLKGPCIDSLGQPILCQEIIVEFDRSMLNSSGNPDSLKNLVREELGMYLIDSCTCGDVELWGTSDTAALDLLAIGRGTRGAANTADNRAELLSASPNYNLLASNNNSATPYPPINPIGSSMPSPTLVAIIDAGIDYTHPDLEDRIWINPDEVPNNAIDDDGNCVADDLIGFNFLDKNNKPYDDHGHGTAIAGVISGRSTNSISSNNTGSDSLAILSLKYTNAEGEGTIFDATCAMYYAGNYNSSNANDSSRVRVINASWGYYGEPSPILQTAIEDAAENCGALIVTAAGNDGMDNDAVAHYPSGFAINNVLSVGAVASGNLETLASYSNYGTASVEIAAIGDMTTTQTGGGTTAEAGTSFSTAQVSRAAGLLFNAYPDASFYAVKYALLKGVDRLQSSDSLLMQSGGRLNLMKSMSILDTLTNRSTCDNSLFVGTIQEPTAAILDEADFRIYPNPFGDALQFEFSSGEGALEDLQIQLIAIDGVVLRDVLLPAGSNRYQLNTQGLAAGVYILHIKGNHKQISKKIIKLRD